MGLPCDVAEVEHRWQARWEAASLHEPDLDRTDPAAALYNLVEFPYPSAAGLHIGHAMTYSGADTWGRYQRMRGRTVFQPIGFDSFGINAENYALRVGRHPGEVMAETTANYRRQLRELGGAWAWSAEVSTSEPSYYRWTQWLFLRLFEAGLAYQASAPVVWCPSCLTVLAREQLEEGRCERCGATVTERVMRQWFLRTTRYADRLVDGLGGLDWPEKARNRQRAWIGRDVDPATGQTGLRLHDWLISRQRFWGPPIPIVHCPRDGAVPVPDEQLPVLLPDLARVDEVRPTGSGRSPLAAVEWWVRTACPRCGGPAQRETDVSDTFFDSAWYFLRYPSVTAPSAGEQPWDPGRTARWLPVDQYAGGPEHVTRHHLYARFVTMALHDQGLLRFAEPFPRVRLHGMLTMGGAKMSKSRGNVLNPDALVAAHGADVARMALLFRRPWDADGDFDEAAASGVARFLGRLWRLVVEAPPGTDDHCELLGRTAARVGRAVEGTSFNVAISALMEAVSAMRRSPPSPAARRGLVTVLAPLAPHVSEELWARLGGPFSVHLQPWPAG